MKADTTIVIPILESQDEASLVSDIYNETHGPRKGIFLTIKQAQQLIQFHLPDKQLERLFYFKRGYNNRVYLAQCTDGTEYVVRLAGRFWDHKKITNEVLALQLARTALEDVVNVPEIVGTSIEEAKVHREQESRIIPYDYIIMSRLSGVPLDTIWKELAFEDKKRIVDQVAKIFARLRSIELTAVGNFVSGPGGKPEVGLMMEGGGGPYKTWGEYVAGNIQQEVKNMLRQETKFVEISHHLPRLETLVEMVHSGDLEKRFKEKNRSSGGVTIDRPISFLHGDFESRNMLVVGTTIVGLHDFEFAGGFPSEQEWCAGFEWLFARAVDPFDAGEQQKLRDMTEDQKELLAYFLGILKDRHGVRQYGAGYQEYKVVLYHLQNNIAPWWLRDYERHEWTETQLQSMKEASESLDKALVFLGC
ncbi:hypothetical protein BG011_001625 [Mortierella polycephala]|uniref:Aminoglycoside phosphotransferase domain-containing protein n=1 Tax=Mortierella polycephala TaxID=41804 RepID=A0A9P6U5N8_9FUNG|nr:hypothetical protein BG011_001625 [Mortierella polycephala]